jgi:hypothetical protein
MPRRPRAGTASLAGTPARSGGDADVAAAPESVTVLFSRGGRWRTVEVSLVGVTTASALARDFAAKFAPPLAEGDVELALVRAGGEAMPPEGAIAAAAASADARLLSRARLGRAPGSRVPPGAWLVASVDGGSTGGGARSGGGGGGGSAASGAPAAPTPPTPAPAKKIPYVRDKAGGAVISSMASSLAAWIVTGRMTAREALGTVAIALALLLLLARIDERVLHPRALWAHIEAAWEAPWRAGAAAAARLVCCGRGGRRGGAGSDDAARPHKE